MSMQEHGWFYGWEIKSDKQGAAIATKGENELAVEGCKDDDEALKQIMEAIDDAEDAAMNQPTCPTQPATFEQYMRWTNGLGTNGTREQFDKLGIAERQTITSIIEQWDANKEQS